MQSFKQLKKGAKQTIRFNYWRLVVVCLFVAVVAGLYSSMFSIGSLTSSSETEKQDAAVDKVRDEIIRKLDGIIDGIDSIKGISPVVKQGVQVVVEHTFDSDSAILNIARSAIMFASSNTVIVGIGLLIGFVVKIAYDIFISASLRVGEKRYFLEARRYKTRIIKTFFIHK